MDKCHPDSWELLEGLLLDVTLGEIGFTDIGDNNVVMGAGYNQSTIA